MVGRTLLTRKQLARRDTSPPGTTRRRVKETTFVLFPVPPLTQPSNYRLKVVWACFCVSTSRASSRASSPPWHDELRLTWHIDGFTTQPPNTKQAWRLLPGWSYSRIILRSHWWLQWRDQNQVELKSQAGSAQVVWEGTPGEGMTLCCLRGAAPPSPYPSACSSRCSPLSRRGWYYLP